MPAAAAAKERAHPLTMRNQPKWRASRAKSGCLPRFFRPDRKLLILYESSVQSYDTISLPAEYLRAQRAERLHPIIFSLSAFLAKDSRRARTGRHSQTLLHTFTQTDRQKSVYICLRHLIRRASVRSGYLIAYVKRISVIESQVNDEEEQQR